MPESLPTTYISPGDTVTALADYQRIVITGKGPGSEVWQTGFSTVVTTPITSQASLQSYCNSIAPFVTTWWTSIKALCYPLYQLTGVSAYQYQAPSTHAQFQAQTLIGPTPGTNASAASPIDTAVVVSLRTAVPGRRSRGRMYVPCHAQVQVADGNFNSVSSNLCGTATKTMFSSIVSGTAGAPTVVSRAGNVHNLVNALVTDTKPDVQRRRENRLAATSVQTLSFP